MSHARSIVHGIAARRGYTRHVNMVGLYSELTVKLLGSRYILQFNAKSFIRFIWNVSNVRGFRHKPGSEIEELHVHESHAFLKSEIMNVLL